MSTPTMPSMEHTQFDALTAPVEDFETLPTVSANVERDESDWEEPDQSLDELILAGLVAPH